jgi:hypothetical protein
MRWLALFAIFCPISVAETHGTASVTVLLSGETAPALVLRALQREAESALAPSRLTLSWLSSHEAHVPDVNGRMAIIRLRGLCRASGPVRTDPVVNANGDPVLGQTHIVAGRVLPIADVLCDAVRKVVERDLKTAPPRDREELLGRALGRVAAHELYHILVRTTEHARNGLSRPGQNSTELLAPRESFNPQDEQRIADSPRVELDDTGR